MIEKRNSPMRRGNPITPPPPLDEAAVERSRRQNGTNELSIRRGVSFARRFISNLGDPVIRILLCALGVNLLFAFKGADWAETAGIALAVLLATTISTLSEHGSEAAFARLSAASSGSAVRVRRRQDRAIRVCEIPLGRVVVGDTVLLGAGEMIPADGYLISGRLQVDQSAMTGESREVDVTPLLASDAITLPTEKGSATPHPTPGDPAALFRGCVILGGSGEMVVSHVGDHTYLGAISEELQMDTRESPLKLRLGRLAAQISRLGYVAAGLVALVFLLGAFLFDSGFDKGVILAKLSDWRYVWQQLFHALTLGLTVLVVAVPEGLPMMIAVVLSSNIKRMVKNQVLVRKPVGLEAAGSMNLLFTDKTGTLTEGKLGIGRILWGNGEACEDLVALRKSAPSLYTVFADAAVTNTESVPGIDSTVNVKRKLPPRFSALGGNATDRALLDAVLATEADAGRSTPPDASPILRKLPFDSNRKCSVAAVRSNGRDVLYVKGAPEVLFPRLSHVLRADGRAVPADKAALRARIHAETDIGGRVILICRSTEGQPLPSWEAVTRGETGPLTLICALLLTDRLRAGAPKAVRTLRRAGIHVVMMTGDNKETAAAIATTVGILDKKVDLVLESRDLAALSDDDVRALLPRLGVLARALPSDKSRLVRLAQEENLVVGMTGDGINDAPALRRADIGFAMGGGTQVAKDAGDIIILDNDLASICRAVLFGRTIFKSIRKFITLQLTMNLSAVGVTVIAPLLGVDAPVTVVQMLWINLIMDTLGGLAFAGEAPLESYMEEPPKRRDEPILCRYMSATILSLAAFTVTLCLLFLKHPAIVGLFRPARDNIYHLTAFFALFIFASVLNCFLCRTDRIKLTAGLGSNPAFLGIMAAVLATQLLFVYVGGPILRTSPLTLRELAITSLFAFSVLPAGAILRLIRRRRHPGEGF